MDGVKRDLGSINHAIVSDADALSRLTDASIGYLQETYRVSEVEVVAKLLELYRNWFITEEARRMAHEELRKLRAYQRMTGIWKPGGTV